MDIEGSARRVIGSLGVKDEALGIAWSGKDQGGALWHRRGDDPQGGEPRFVIYSITKSMIATIVLALQEVGRLHVDAPLSDFYPDIPNARKISLRRMLNHTAGFSDYGAVPEYSQELARDPEHPWDFARFAAETWEKGMPCEPGERWHYSNVAYMLLVRVIEDVAEMSLRRLVDFWIVEPLGLERTSVVETIDDLSDLAPAPSAALSPKGEMRDIRKHYHPGWVAHGLVASTPSETTRFVEALSAGEILTMHTLEEMLRPVRVPDDSPRWKEPGYGLGVMIDPEAPWGSFYGHGGTGPGTTTFVAHFPDEDLTLCVMSAGEEREAEAIVEEVRS